MLCDKCLNRLATTSIGRFFGNRKLCGLRVASCGLRGAGCGMRDAGCEKLLLTLPSGKGEIDFKRCKNKIKDHERKNKIIRQCLM